MLIQNQRKRNCPGLVCSAIWSQDLGLFSGLLVLCLLGRVWCHHSSRCWASSFSFLLLTNINKKTNSSVPEIKINKINMSNILAAYIRFWRTHQWITFFKYIQYLHKMTISYQSRPFHKCIKYEHHMQSGVNIPWVECSNVVVKRSVSSLVVWSNTSIRVWSVVSNKTTTASASLIQFQKETSTLSF